MTDEGHPPDRVALGQHVHHVRDGRTLCDLEVTASTRSDLVALREWPPCPVCLERRVAEVAAKAGAHQATQATLEGLAEAMGHERRGPWVFRVTMPKAAYPSGADGARAVQACLERALLEAGLEPKVLVEWVEGAGRRARAGHVGDAP